MIRNFYDVKPDFVKNIHDGEGVVKVANIFETFSTKMQFLHYTVLPPGTTIGAHRHGGDEEFYIILEGNGEMELDGEKFPVTAGHVIRNEPFGSHGLKNLSEQDDLRILVFEVKQ